MNKSYFRALTIAAAVSFGSFYNVASAGNYTLDDIKQAVAQYPEIQYAMMGDVVFLHGSTDHIPELSNIIGKLMKIDGVKEVRSNIFSK